MSRSRELANLGNNVGASNINSATNQITDSSTDLNVDSNTLVVDKSANAVGIGASPSETLTVAQGTTERAIAVCSSDANVGGFIGATGESGASNKLVINGSRGSGAIIFQTVSSEAMRIDSTGNVLIGTDTLNGANGGAAFADSTFDRKTLHLSHSDTGTARHLVQFFTTASTTRVGYIACSTTAVTYATSSDYRLKENVTPLTGAIDRINQLKPSRFNFIADPETLVDGFLAHEVSDIVPEAVSGEKDAVDENGDIESQGIDQSKLVPLLVASVQELSAKVTALENATN